LLVRVLTAAALAAAFLGALFLLDRSAFAAFVAALVALGAYEWARLLRLGRGAAAGYALACVALFAALARQLLPSGLGSQPFAAVLWTAVAYWVVIVPGWLAYGVSSRAAPVLGAAGVAVLVPAALVMAAMPPARVLMLMGLVWTADIAAYLAGGALGRRKLAPSISPGKTWEGVAGAALAVLIYAIICAGLDPELDAWVQGARWAPYLAGALALCAAGIVGDLFESALKRQAGAKDSGSLLPGHGGVLDRIDSATAALPLGALLLAWIGAT
jgi:phosphatidate cytidylyltransferase